MKILREVWVRRASTRANQQDLTSCAQEEEEEFWQGEKMCIHARETTAGCTHLVWQLGPTAV
jgi:hypothetical protein